MGKNEEGGLKRGHKGRPGERRHCCSKTSVLTARGLIGDPDLSLVLRR